MAKSKKKKGVGTKGGKSIRKSNYQPVDVRDVNELWVKVNFKVSLSLYTVVRTRNNKLRFSLSTGRS